MASLLRDIKRATVAGPWDDIRPDLMFTPATLPIYKTIELLDLSELEDLASRLPSAWVRTQYKSTGIDGEEVVDDGPYLREVLHSYLARASHGAFPVFTQDEALATLAGRPLRRFSSVTAWPETDEYAENPEPTWANTRTTFTENGWLRATLRARGCEDRR